MKVRIQKFLASQGVDSRRHIEEMIAEGRISVNGRVTTRLPVMVDPVSDRIEIDGEPVAKASRKEMREQQESPQNLVYILMNKPAGVHCTNVSQGEQERAIDLLPPGFDTRVFPVGRLDAESMGLLLLTNDGDLTHKLTHPRYGVVKVYRVIVDGEVMPDLPRAMREGVWLADPDTGGFKASAEHVKIVRSGRDQSTLDITLKEGRNRQVRRMLAHFGHKVRRLTRIQMGPLELERLKPGQSRLLTPIELTKLKRAVDRAERANQVEETPATPLPNQLPVIKKSADRETARLAKRPAMSQSPRSREALMEIPRREEESEVELPPTPPVRKPKPKVEPKPPTPLESPRFRAARIVHRRKRTD